MIVAAMDIAETRPAEGTPPFVDDPGRWAAVVARDRRADGVFWYAVATTGVYCRPSCGARLARRENVAFHDSPAAAEAAGFRPCKRCRPDQPPRDALRAAAVVRACRRIETAGTAPALAALAAEAGMSPFHFHRVFKAVTGLTPKAYADAHRANRVKARLARADSVTDAIVEAGYGSSSRFYERAGGMLGMRPADFRDGGRDAEIRFAVADCALGTVLVAATGRGVCAIHFGDDADELVREVQDRFPKARLVGGDPDFDALVARVIGLVEAPGAPGADALPLDVRGTAFQHLVWAALRAIPPGRTASYAEVAAAIGRPSAVRAVARACATNEVAVAIPCHRVVRIDGGAGGYRWGVERKAALLAREAGA
jgi:AraC family transcriptional regulator of adaptative response/methylated-DNA-[protein]-cysteine methyltransferase